MLFVLGPGQPLFKFSVADPDRLHRCTVTSQDFGHLYFPARSNFIYIKGNDLSKCVRACGKETQREKVRVLKIYVSI